MSPFWLGCLGGFIGGFSAGILRDIGVYLIVKNAARRNQEK